MGVTVAVTRTTCNVALGNQDITTADLGGLTPKAALFIGCGATVDGTAHDDLSACYGAATGSSERWVIATASENNLATTNTARRGATDECVMFIDGNGAVDGEADFVTFIANGCRINWGNAPSSAWYLTVVFYAGTDLTADADVFTLGNQDVEVDVNTVGFEPDLLLLGSIARAIDDNVGAHVHFSTGAAANKVGDPQYSYEYRSTDNVGTSAVQGRVTDDYAAMQIDSAAALDWGCEITNWDANGFSAFARGGNSGDDVGYLALAFGGVVDFKVGSISSPVANGNQAIVDPAFTPQLVQVGMTQLVAFDTAYTGGEAGAYGVSAFDDDDEYSNAYADEDAQGTSDTQSLSDNQAVNFPQDDGTAGYAATFVSFDVNGWTWNFTAQLGTAHLWWYYAIETEAASSSSSSSSSSSQSSSSSSSSQSSSSSSSSQSSSSSSSSQSSSSSSSSSSVSHSTSSSSSSSSSTSTSSSTTQLPCLPTATHEESVELTINIYDPDISSYEPAGTLVGSYSADITAYQQLVSAWIGYDSASITITGPLVEIEDWIERGPGRHVEIYNPALVKIWEGVVNLIGVGAGPLAQTVGPLLDIGNRASVMYAPILDATVDPPVVGTTQPTTIAENTDSQARYGIIEKVLSGGTSTTDDAERYRDTYLNEHAWPESGETVTPGGGSEPSVRLDCLGYGAFLGAYAYNTTTTGTTTASVKVQAVLAADPNGLFSTDYTGIETNGYLVPAYEGDNAYADSVIKSIVALGDINDDRWLFGIYNDRKAQYNEVPTDVAYYHRLSDPAQRIETPSGTLVYPWDVKPGRWLFIPDWLTGRTEPSVRRRDLRYIFIESVEYTAPFDLRINGHKIGKLSQLLAKQGLGGTGA